MNQKLKEVFRGKVVNKTHTINTRRGTVMQICNSRRHA